MHFRYAPTNDRRPFWQQLDAFYGLVFSEDSILVLKHLLVRLSIAGFLLHLLLIYLSRSLSHPPALLVEIGTNYLTAISTPFNFILFYEVLTLIAALPGSSTRSMAAQFEIVSLIFIRDVFRDIAEAGDLVSVPSLTRQQMPVFVDMAGGLAMFLAVAVFRHVALYRPHIENHSGLPFELVRFVLQKKLVALGLAVLLVFMAVRNLYDMFAHALLSLHGEVIRALEPTTFYHDLFTVMIFTDVLILILSLVIAGQYEMVFRNAGFVASIILIRFSLTEGFPLGVPLALGAMLFAILILVIFNYHARLLARRSRL